MKTNILVPTLKEIPSAQRFVQTPNRENARKLVHEIRKIVYELNLDGNAPPLLRDALMLMNNKNQYHLENTMLLTDLYEHSHDEPNRKQAINQLVENAKKAYQEGDRFAMSVNIQKAVHMALENNWFEIAFKAGDSITAFGLNPISKSIYLRLAAVAREIGDQKRVAKYEEMAGINN